MSPSRMRRIPATVLATLTLAAVLVGCGAPVGDRPNGGTAPESPTAVPPFPQLEVGDCTNIDDADGSIRVEVAPCDQPHTEQVFHRIDLPDGPFDLEAIDKATQECVGQAFTDFIGVPREESVLLVTPVIPTSEQWEAGARTLYCSVFDEAGELSTSLEGAAR